MFVFGVHPIELVARTVIVYVVFIAVLRVFGKRELGQFTSSTSPYCFLRPTHSNQR